MSDNAYANNPFAAWPRQDKLVRIAGQAGPWPPTVDLYVKPTAERHAGMLARFNAGETVEAIAESYGVVPATIAHHLRRLQDGGPRTGPNNRTKLQGHGIDTERWLGLLPYAVAWRQIAWERRQQALRGRAAGLTYEAIGEYLNVTKERVRQMVLTAKREARRRPPAVAWYQTRDIYSPRS